MLMQSTRYSAEDEQALMARLWTPRIKDNPLNFVALVFPWGVKGTPLENFKGPRKWQREVLREIRDFLKLNQGRIDSSELIEAMRGAGAARGVRGARGGRRRWATWAASWWCVRRTTCCRS